MSMEKAIFTLEKMISEYDLSKRRAESLRQTGPELSADFADMDVHHARQDLLDALSQLSAFVGWHGIIPESR